MKKNHPEMTDEEKEAYGKLHEKFEIVPKKTHAKKNKQTLFSHTIGILKQRKYARLSAIVIIAFFILYSFLYGLWQVPFLQLGVVRVSEITIIDILFVILISSMAGLLVSLLRFRMDDKAGPGLGGAGGMFAGFVSAICPACQGITFAALGSTFAIPLAFLIPYLWILQIATIFVLGLSLYLVSNSIYTKTCISCNMIAATKKAGHDEDEKKEHHSRKHFLYDNNIAFASLMVLVLLLMINNFMITTAFAAVGNAAGGGGSISIKPGFEYGPKLTLKPMPLAVSESPRFQGYKSIVKPLPTISELSI
ncbi:MAG: hypothetical protein QMD85_03280, partial [Candidatus Aenigmarchaeota archaeon]|nr:hypothetical protein [Candidatus Aenigmarchaeota archaeon]MDI6722567.1 hypothetical protein [Candidatus Aenigmarchaeota archaeon]